MDLITWSWAFCIVCAVCPLSMDVVGGCKVAHAADSANASRSCRQVLPAAALPVTTTGGAMYTESPGLAYEHVHDMTNKRDR